jgi:hypothetical protein
MNDEPLTNSAAHTYRMWLDGDCGPQEALRALTNDYVSILDQETVIALQKAALRDQMAHIVSVVGKIYIPGFGKLELTPDTVTRSYDREALDELIVALAAQGDRAANLIAACKHETPRRGGLKVTRDK